MKTTEDMPRDIFISYKNDVGGNNFAARLCEDLEKCGFENNVYYNPNQQHAGDFPQQLREAVENCKDFLLVLTQDCLDQLIRHEKVDWVREELLIAHKNKLEGKTRIIPLLMPGVVMPKDKEIMPEDLRFLPDTNAVSVSDSYLRAPFDIIRDWMYTKPGENSALKNTYNSSTENSIDDDFRAMEESENLTPKEMYELANYYYYGLTGSSEKGCKRDFSKAYKLLKKITETENEYTLHACSLIAEMSHNGVIPRESQSYEYALELHKKAKEVSGFSRREYAYLQSRGCGCEFDFEEIEKSYLEVNQSGDTVSILQLATIYKNFGHFKKAAEYYKKIRDKTSRAEYNLGMLYRNGLITGEPDYEKAAFCFQRATEFEDCDSDAYFQLGRLYFTPTGEFTKNFKRAQANFKKAADMGNKGAQYKMGLMYEYGYVEKNIPLAIKYHTDAANQGVSFSNYHLALLYQEPECKDYDKAYRYAEIAARTGVMEGEYLLGMFLLYGRGCVADKDRAYKYFNKAFRHGMHHAKLMMEKIGDE